MTANSNEISQMWSAEADCQASHTVCSAAFQALLVLSPSLRQGQDDLLAAATRLDQPAVRRVLDMLEETSTRFKTALHLAQTETDMESALIEAARRLPDDLPETARLRAMG